jgi:thymidylate synthase (FAD)
MLLRKPQIRYQWMTPNPLAAIERAGRTAYKSEDRITDSTAPIFVQLMLDNGHHSVIEHASMSYRIICDRGVSHEIVRHRLFSYTQESTRYCDYKGGVTFIIPPWIKLADEYERDGANIENMDMMMKVLEASSVNIASSTGRFLSWLLTAEQVYQDLRKNAGWRPQQARAILPNALKTEIVITGNLREWLHFFMLRCARVAHPQMREIAHLIWADASQKIPVVFESVSPLISF